MKKNILFLAAVLTATVCFSQQGTTGALSWSLKNDTLIISGEGAMPDYGIYPSDAPWISYKETIKSIIIKEGITNVGKNAFFECAPNLKSALLPNSLKSIGSNAFGYSSLSEISIPDSVTYIGGSAFQMSGLTSISIPPLVTEIGSFTFSNCKALTSVKLPNTIKKIGNGAFQDNPQLASINIPDSLEDINEYTFFQCSSLTSLSLPNTISSIGTYAFGYSGLESIDIPNSVTTIDDYAFYRCDSLKTVNIPALVRSIGVGVFFYCKKLESVNIAPSGNLEYIGENTFMNCESLKSIFLPNSLKTLSSKVFYNCVNLSEVNIPESMQKIENSTFWGCYALDSVEIPNTITSIGESAYQACFGLTSVSIPSSVTSIEKEAFFICRDLKEIKIEWQYPLSISADDLVFYDVPNTCILKVPAGTAEAYSKAEVWKDFIIQEEAEICTRLADSDVCWKVVNDTILILSGQGDMPHILGADELDYNYAVWPSTHYENIKSVIIEDGITGIGNGAFMSFMNVTSFEIPNSVTHIGKYSFQSCKSLRHIELPNSIKYIDGYGFQNCQNLEFIKLSDSLVSIGDYAFQDCQKLVSIELPNSLVTLKMGAFNYCKGLEFIQLPKSLENIGYTAFSFCEKLSFIEIPQSVKAIEGYAFSYCENLKVLYYNAVSLDSAHFTWIGGLESQESIIIGNDVKSLPDYAFFNCYKVPSIKIPASVEFIGNWVFKACSGLKEIIVEWKEPLEIDLTQEIFDMVPVSSCILKVPAGTAEAYRQAEVWKDFIIEEYESEEKVDVTPAEESVEFSWLPNEEATGYILTIYKDENRTEILYTFYFDNEGQLITNLRSTTTGMFTHTVADLNPGTVYYYSLSALDNNDQTIETLRGEFVTEGGGTVYIPDELADDMMLYVENRTIVIENIENSIVSLYNTTGQLLVTCKATNSIVRIPVLHTGIYIVNVDGKVQKLLVK